MSDILSARSITPTAPPPLTETMRCHLMRGLRATIRRDETSAHYLRLAGQPVGALLERIARNTADLHDLAEIRGGA